jgi:hypothetical protein
MFLFDKCLKKYAAVLFLYFHRISINNERIKIKRISSKSNAKSKRINGYLEDKKNKAKQNSNFD